MLLGFDRMGYAYIVYPFLADVAYPVDVKTTYKKRHSVAMSFINVLETNDSL